MNILIVYDTYSGGTLEAAQFVFSLLSQKNQQVTLKRADEISKDDFLASDFIIFATPSWFVDNIEGKPHINFIKLMDTVNNVQLANKKCAVFGLGDQSYAHFCGGVTILEKFIGDNGGTIVAKSLKLDSYYANKESCHAKLSSWIETLPLSA